MRGRVYSHVSIWTWGAKRVCEKTVSRPLLPSHSKHTITLFPCCPALPSYLPSLPSTNRMLRRVVLGTFLCLPSQSLGPRTLLPPWTIVYVSHLVAFLSVLTLSFAAFAFLRNRPSEAVEITHTSPWPRHCPPPAASLFTVGWLVMIPDSMDDHVLAPGCGPNSDPFSCLPGPSLQDQWHKLARIQPRQLNMAIILQPVLSDSWVAL